LIYFRIEAGFKHKLNDQKYLKEEATMRHQQVLVHVRKNLLVVLSAILLAITFGGAARLGAQGLAGSLTGLIADPTGAVVVSADVVLTDVDKGYKYTSVSSAEGRYTFRDLSPGNYKLNVKKQGFESFSLSGILIEVNENTSRNVQLTVGNTSETVNVTSEAPLLQTEDATLGLVVDRQFVNDLPLVGRDITSLVYLAPGVTVPQGGTLQATGGNEGNDLNFVSDGQRNATAALFVDGVVTSQGDPNPGVERPLYVPSPDAVAEFKVEQGVIRADSGFSGGTIVNIVTRSGSNQFHGTVYDFDQNNSFNANSYSNNEYGVKNQPSNTNTFGGVVGGPIKKDKTFFFAVFNGLRSRSAGSSLAWVPSAAERAGDFSEICQTSFDGSGRCQDDIIEGPSNVPANFGQLWDPYTATTYNGGDVLPQAFIPYNNLARYVSPGPNPLENGPITLPARAGNVIDPSANIVMNTAFPMPNIPGAAENAVNYYSVTHGNGANNEVDLRLDQRFTASDNLAVKYLFAWGKSNSPGCLPGVWDPCSNGPNTGHTYNLALNYSRPLNSHMLLQLQGGVIGNVNVAPGITSSEYPGFDPVTALGMPSYIDSSGFKAAPYINYAGPGLGTIGSKLYAIWNIGFTTWQMGGSLDVTKGKQEIKVGGDWKFVFERNYEPGVPAGQYSFSTNGTAPDETSGTGGGNSLASLMIGSPLNNAAYQDYEQLNTSQPDYDLFVQDTWRILPKLTLDLGLRYEIQVPETDANNDIQWFDPNAPSPYASYLPGLKGAIDFAGAISGERRPIDTSYNNIEPRVGFAYKVNSATVLRGGYGIYFSPSIASAAGGTSGNSPGASSYTSFPEYLYNGIAGSDGATPGERFSNPFPGGILQPPANSPSPLAFAGLGNMGIAVRNPQIPYSQTFTLGVQRDLPMKSVLNVYYVGTKGTHLYTQQSPSLDSLPISVEANTPAQNEALANGVSPNPFYGAPTAQGCMGGNFFCQSTVPNWYLDVPFPQYIGFGTGNTTFTHSWYHSLQATFQKRLTHGLEGHASYTWSKSTDDGSSTGGGSAYLDPPGDEQGPIDPNRIYLEHSLSGFDIPQNLTFAYTYALPFGRGRDYGSSVNSFVDAVLGGWNTSGMWAFQSGFPLALAQQTGTPIPTYWHRPTMTGILRKSSSFKKPGDNYFPANWSTIIGPSPSFVVPLDEAPRYEGSVRAPGINTASLGVFKSFNLNALREGARFEFRVEAFNAFNHPQFPGPVPTVDGGSFGVVYAEQVNSPRQVQFGGKLYF
jgi:hypothetical protein